MIALNIPEKTARNLLDYINEFLDSTCSLKFKREAEQDKNRIKRAIGRAEGRPKSMLNDFRLGGVEK
mgnify:CR=1 FL=1